MTNQNHHLQETLLAARNALAICQRQVLRAYLAAPPQLTRPLYEFLFTLDSDRATLNALQDLASELAGEPAVTHFEYPLPKPPATC